MAQGVGCLNNQKTQYDLGAGGRTTKLDGRQSWAGSQRKICKLLFEKLGAVVVERKHRRFSSGGACTIAKKAIKSGGSGQRQISTDRKKAVPIRCDFNSCAASSENPTTDKKKENCAKAEEDMRQAIARGSEPQLLGCCPSFSTNLGQTILMKFRGEGLQMDGDGLN